MFKPSQEWLQEMAATWAATYRFLEEVAPCGYKMISAVKLAVGESGARWQGDSGEDSGIVTFFPDAEPRSIAHEIGEGLFERLSHYSKGDFWPLPIHDDFAEAVRYFVEKRMGMSSWQPRADWLRVLVECDYDEKKFKSKLQDSSLVTFLKEKVRNQRHGWSASPSK